VLPAPPRESHDTCVHLSVALLTNTLLWVNGECVSECEQTLTCSRSGGIAVPLSLSRAVDRPAVSLSVLSPSSPAVMRMDLARI
jgi:hypothetical protein